MGCETDIEIPEDETDCPIDTQSESIISSTIQTNLHRQQEQYNKGGLKKLMIQ